MPRSGFGFSLLIILAVALTSSPPEVNANSDFSVVHGPDLIVVGKMHRGATVPWIDGWHMFGTIGVDEVLYGPRVPRVVSYRSVCRWKEACPYWPPPPLAECCAAKGI